MRRLLSEVAEHRSPDESIVFESYEELEDYVLRAFAGLSEAKGDKWIQKAIKKPGRCKDMGGPDCPKGSPQYNLAKRFKPGGDLYKG